MKEDQKKCIRHWTKLYHEYIEKYQKKPISNLDKKKDLKKNTNDERKREEEFNDIFGPVKRLRQEKSSDESVFDDCETKSSFNQKRMRFLTKEEEEILDLHKETLLVRKKIAEAQLEKLKQDQEEENDIQDENRKLRQINSFLGECIVKILEVLTD